MHHSSLKDSWIQFASSILTATILLLCVSLRSPAAPIDPTQATKDADGVLWFDVRLLSIEGQGFADTEAPFDRLPSRAHGEVRDAVWNLSRHSAGMCVRFVTDAATIQARWTLIAERLAMPHMPATAVSGLDLYVKTDDGHWRWLAVGRPTQFPTNSVRLVDGIAAERREYLLYLPLYNGVSSVEIGIPDTANLQEPPQRDEAHRKPIVFYGTSITQGGCASRAGMVHTAILGRRFDRPVINLGFSGNGRMEAELAALLAELAPAVYVLDCLPNMGPDDVTARVEPTVRALRAAHPKTPIVLVEDRNYTDGFLVTARQKRNTGNHAALRAAYERLLAAGIGALYYLEGDRLLGDDGEATVDGSHPTDLGFMRQADAFAEVLAPLLP